MKSNPAKPIYRRFDQVEIVEPAVFVRVGYPMAYDATLTKIEEQYGAQIYGDMEALEHVHRAEGWPEHLVGAFSAVITDAMRSLTKAHLVHHSYGGRERTVHTRLEERLRGKIARVGGKRVVNTGLYNRGSTYHGFDYTESEPPYLSNVKAHVILRLDLTGPHAWDYEQVEIEECHVRHYVEAANPQEEMPATFTS